MSRAACAACAAARRACAALLFGASAVLAADDAPPAAAATASAAALPAGLQAQVDAKVRQVLADTGVPSASVALVRDRRIVLARAWGSARLEPARAATPQTRYPVGSISKEFTAATLVLLEQERRLSLDDEAGRYVPNLGAAAHVSLRALLSHTSGIRDFWPQDFELPEMRQPVEPTAILARWAAAELDFAPGTRWQYSNTGYTLAGVVAERVGGAPLFAQMQRRILGPLGMTSAIDLDAHVADANDATGYLRYALGPLRPTTPAARGWLFAAGSLALTASDLARWDISLMDGAILGSVGTAELTREVLLASGAGTRYALGLDVALDSGQRVIGHGGEVDGFTASNQIYPELGIAAVVLTNQEAIDASETLARGLARLLVASLPDEAASHLASDRALFLALQQGTLESRLLTDNGRYYFTPTARADFHRSLAPLGRPLRFELAGSGVRGGLLTREYTLAFARRTLKMLVRATPEGLIEQCTIAPP